MALKSEKQGNVVTRLAAAEALPKMARVRQRLDHSHIDVAAIPGIVREQLGAALGGRIRPGMRVAVTCGSRGVANIAAITRAIVDYVKEQGGEPFVFPAMGSHGGATADGQREILAGYGVTEESLGCPILSSMEVVQVGETEEGMPVFCDKHAHGADAIILCGRVKAHTAFAGNHESGILKMAVIGMGKQHGAETVHRDGFFELGRLLPMIGRVVLENTKVIGAVGLVENAFDQTCVIKAVASEDIWQEEPKLLAESKRRLGRIFFDNLDVLVVDRLGKDISGDGMDPHITGRFAVPHMEGKLKVQHIAVLDLTDESHGNCNGLGLADVTTKRLVDKIDVDATYPNVVTSTVLCTPKIPLFTHSDRACIQIALRTCNYIDRAHPRMVRIRDTMHVEDIWISEALLPEAEAHPDVEVLEQPAPWAFDAEGNLW